MENPIKMDDWGVPLFLETPTSSKNDLLYGKFTEPKASKPVVRKEYHHTDRDDDDNDESSLRKPGTNTNSVAPFCHPALSNPNKEDEVFLLVAFQNVES